MADPANPYSSGVTSNIILEPGSLFTKGGYADPFRLPKVKVMNMLEGGASSPVMAGGIVQDWDSLTELWRRVLVRDLGLKRKENEANVLVCAPISWTKHDYERVTQIMFEVMNVEGLFILPQPLATVYALSLTTGVVIDIGHETTDITPVIDSKIIYHASVTVPLGGKDVDDYLLNMLLGKDEFALAHKGKPVDPVLLSKCKETLGADHATYNDVDIPGKFSSCVNVLFNPSYIGKHCLSVQEAIAIAISYAGEAETQSILWDCCILTGGMSNMSGLRNVLEAQLSSILAASETSNEYQPKDCQWKALPDYFVDYQGKPGDVNFIGSSVISKVAFQGSPFLTYVTKEDYNKMGPPCIHLKQ